MSIRKIIHNTIAGHLNRKEEDVNPYGLQWVDLWKAQVGTNQEQKYPFNFPAAFVSTSRIAWQDMLDNVKEGTTQIEVFLFFNKYQDTFEGATDKDSSLSIIDTVDEIAEDLHWIEKDPFKELTQIYEDDLTTTYGRPAYKLTFETIIYKQINNN